MKSFLLLLLLSFFFPPPVFAESPTLTVSPSIIRLDLATDKPEAILSYNNASDHTIELAFSASDFTELEHGYKPNFLTQKDAQNYRYALSSWISFDKNTLVIPPHTTEKITVFINTAKLSPGGHYGSILGQITSSSGNKEVQIQGVLSSLIFVRTATGKEKDEAKIATFVPERSLFSFPQIFTFRFQNTGDTELVPYGLVTIRDMFGRTVAKGILNEGSLIALPESIRRYEIPIKPQTFLLPGTYTADFTGHFGTSRHPMQQQVTFFSEGTLPLLTVGFVVGLALCFVIWKKRKG